MTTGKLMQKISTRVCFVEQSQLSSPTGYFQFLISQINCQNCPSLIIDSVNFQKMLTLEANRVNLGYTNFLGVLRVAEHKYVVCPAQNCPQMPQNPIWPPPPDKNVFMYIYFGQSKAETRMKCAFACFNIMWNPMPYSRLR